MGLVGISDNYCNCIKKVGQAKLEKGVGTSHLLSLLSSSVILIYILFMFMSLADDDVKGEKFDS